MRNSRWGWLPLAALVAVLGTSACGDNNNSGSMETPAPTPTATPAPPVPCPQLVTYIVRGAASDVDFGWTGIYFDQPVGTGAALTFAVDCPGEFLGGCGECPISGPIKSTTVVDNQRCANASEIVCDSDADCPGSECSFFFGAPIPASGGGIPICVTNRITNDVTGAIVPEIGSGSSDMDIELVIHSGLSVEQPCPVCDGGAFAAAGTCQGGPRDGETCVVHGTTELGNTSFDCLPAASAVIGITDVPLDPTTAARTLEPTETCTAIGAVGDPCYCPGQERPNACLDGVCTADDQGDGECLGGPVDLLCAAEPFRSCIVDDDCSPGDACVPKTRGCSGATDDQGVLAGSFTRTGAPSPEHPLQVSTFCVEGTSSIAVNAAAGLPGPVGVRLPTDACPFPSCPP